MVLLKTSLNGSEIFKNFEEWRKQNLLDDEYFHRNDMYWYARTAWRACETINKKVVCEGTLKI